MSTDSNERISRELRAIRDESSPAQEGGIQVEGMLIPEHWSSWLDVAKSIQNDALLRMGSTESAARKMEAWHNRLTDQLRADVLRLEKEKLEIQKELEVEIELRKEIGARLNLKCADLAAARDELEEVRK